MFYNADTEKLSKELDLQVAFSLSFFLSFFLSGVGLEIEGPSAN
jgi:hypothetical protein